MTLMCISVPILSASHSRLETASSACPGRTSRRQTTPLLATPSALDCRGPNCCHSHFTALRAAERYPSHADAARAVASLAYRRSTSAMSIKSAYAAKTSCDSKPDVLYTNGRRMPVLISGSAAARIQGSHGVGETRFQLWQPLS